MRIGDISGISGIYDKQKNFNKVERPSAVASKKDVVSISNKAKDFQTVMKALKENPDIRQDKVNEFTQKYETGTYNVTGGEIADRIIGSSFTNRA